MQTEQAKVWDKTAIHELLDRSDMAVAHAVLRIFERQTDEERTSERTVEHNGRGFTAFDAEFLTSIAKRLPQYNMRMTPKQAAIARNKIKRYWRQLLEEIESRGGAVDYRAHLRKTAAEEMADIEESTAVPPSIYTENPMYGTF